MGIDLCALCILKQLFSSYSFSSVLTIGRQQIHMTKEHINFIMGKDFGLNYGDYSESLFKLFGVSLVDSIDASNYENCTIIHDLNTLIPIISKKYNFIFDGGCSEHIFNLPQVYQNFIDLLEVGGIFVGIVPNNNMSGHGFYQFSPEFFIQVFSTNYSMQLMDIYLAKVNTTINQWIKLDKFINFRNETKFNDTEPVYIIVIAKKISSSGKTLLENPPQQHNYENMDWN